MGYTLAQARRRLPVNDDEATRDLERETQLVMTANARMARRALATARHDVIRPWNLSSLLEMRTFDHGGSEAPRV